nr:hypothetical protein [Tanacetum cinerariifolium]
YSVNPSLNIQNKPGDHELFISKLIQQKLQNEYAQPFPAIAITFDLPSIEPKDSLRMGDENLDTILETESDEIIKSSVENLVPKPSESEDLSDSECNVLVCDDFTTFSNLLFDADDDFSSSDDESFFDEDISKKTYSNSLFDETIPSGIDEINCDPEEEIRLIEKLFNDSLSSPENESFHFDIPLLSRPPAKPPDDDSRILSVKMVGNISEHDVPMPRLYPPNPPSFQIRRNLLASYLIRALKLSSFILKA